MAWVAWAPGIAPASSTSLRRTHTITDVAMLISSTAHKTCGRGGGGAGTGATGSTDTRSDDTTVHWHAARLACDAGSLSNVSLLQQQADKQRHNRATRGHCVTLPKMVSPNPGPHFPPGSFPLGLVS